MKNKKNLFKQQVYNNNRKTNAQNKLAEYVKNQSTYTSLYNSIVNQIKSQYAATYIEKPKYRVKRFWSIPSPKRKISKSSGPTNHSIKVDIDIWESGVANKEEEFHILMEQQCNW